MSDAWKNLDTAKVLEKQKKQHESTTSANVGGFAVPLGAPLRPAIPTKVTAKPKKKKG